MLQRTEYPSSLTEQQWNLIKDLLPKPRRGGRPREMDLRHIVDAIFYLNRTGCPWRYLPKDFPKWRTVYDYFYKWKTNGVWEQLRAVLTEQTRLQAGAHRIPSTVILDSQSAKAHYGECRGYDGFKKVKGRKRHILVDTSGNIHAVKVTAADISESKPGMELLREKERFLNQRKLKAVYVDGGYRSWFEHQVFATFQVWPNVLKAKVRMEKSDDPKYKGTPVKKIIESNLGPKRWVVERTFAWLNYYRRLTRDFEKRVCNSEAMIRIAMTQILLKRLESS